MIVQVVTDRQVGNYLDSMSLHVGCVADTGEHQKSRRTERSGADNYLAARTCGAQGSPVAARDQFHTHSAAVLHDHAGRGNASEHP